MTRSRSPFLPLSLLVFGGCASTGPSGGCAAGEGRTDDGTCAALAGLGFAGIETAAWDGADGLIATWAPPNAAADGTAGALDYTLTVETLTGAPVDALTTDDTTASVTGLADGEYRLRVSAVDAVGRTGGEDRALDQLVGSERLLYRSEVPFPGGRCVDGAGDLVVVGGGGQDDGGVQIVDVHDADAPVVLATIPDLGEITDVALGDGLLFVASDTTLHPDATVAVRIYDLADPAAPTLRGTIAATADSAHTLSFGGGYLFLASTLNGWIASYDVSDPAAPVRVGVWAPPPPAGVHDETWVDGLLYVAYTQGMAIVDVQDPTTPVLRSLLEADWADPFVHNLWPTSDGATLAMSEEAVGGMLRVYDIRDAAALTLVGSWRTTADHSIHNVVVRGACAFAAWYVDGLEVLDLSDPAAPAEVGHYDTYAGDESPETRDDGSQWPNVSGATHVWPFGNHVAVSDAQRGLVLFDFYPAHVTWGDRYEEH